MKPTNKFALIALACAAALGAPLASAAQCDISIKNDVHIGDSELEIEHQGEIAVVMDDDNHLYIHGDKIELDPDQEQAIADYREKINSYVPKAKQMAEESLKLAEDIMDDIAISLDMPGAFDEAKISVKEFFDGLQKKYSENGDWVLPSVDTDELQKSWQQDIDALMAVLNEEFFESAFNALSAKMDQEGSLNLSELADTMAELKANFDERLKAHEAEIERQSQELCDSVGDLAEEEKALHEKIPALKDYQVFTI